MIKTRKRVIISGMIFIILMGILAVFISYSLEKRAQGVSIDSTSDVSAGATRIDREDFNAHFTLGGAVGQRYLDGGAFNPMGPALTDEQTKAKYDESTGIITLTPNRNDWAGNFTLNDRISTQQPFVLKGAVYLGDRTDSDWRDADWGANGGTPSGGADGIGFAFHPEDVGHVGFTGANLGIGGLKGAIGYKFDTYWNTPQQSDADDNHRLGWDADPGNKGAHTGNPFGAFVETTSSPIPAGQPLLDSGRNAPFNTEAGFAVADWNQIAWFDTSKLLQSSGDNRREEIGDPYQGTERRTVDNYGYDANENKPANERDNTRGFIDVIYKYEPNSLQNGHGLLKVYMAQGYVVNANSANTITQEDKVYDLLGQKEITSSDSLALAVSASTGAFRNLQQFRFDYFEYSGVKRLSIDKKWDDNANYMGMRPDEIKVQLWASLEATNELPAVRQPYKEPVSISAANDWHYMVDNLPQYNDQGREIFYDVTELPVSGYQSHVQDITATGDHSDLQFEIDNSLANPLTLSGGKIWLDDGAVDSRPSQISVQLWRNDNGVERQVKFGELATGYQDDYGQVNPEDAVILTTNSNQNWQYSFSHLPARETVNGQEQGIQYFLKEALPDNYKSKYDSQVIGRDIVNTPVEQEKVLRLEVLKLDENFNNPDSPDFGHPMPDVQYELQPINEIGARAEPQGIDLQSDENGVLRQKGNSLIMEDLEIPYGSTQTLKMTHQPIEGFGMNQDIYTISVSDDGQPSVTVNRGGGLSRSQEPVDYTFEDGLLRFVIYSGLNLDFLLQKVDGDNPTSHQILNAAFNLSEYKGNQWSDVTSFKSATQMPNSEFSSIDDLSTKDGKLDLSQIVTDTPNLSRGVIYKLTETKQPDGFQKSLYSILVYKDIDQQVYVRLAEQENGQLLMKDFKDVYPDMMTVSEENSKVQINFPNYREVGNGPKKENGSNGKEQEFSPFGVYAGLGALILGIALAILARVGYKYRHK